MTDNRSFCPNCGDVLGEEGNQTCSCESKTCEKCGEETVIFKDGRKECACTREKTPSLTSPDAIKKYIDDKYGVSEEKGVSLRKFESGAIRDSNENKPNYAGFISPLVIRAFGEYMLKHQTLPDGSKRNADNWKGLFGPDHMKVCFESKVRHDQDLHLIMDGFKQLSRDKLRDVLCAIFFNVQAMLLKVCLDELNEEKK